MGVGPESLRALRVGDGTMSLVEIVAPEPRGEALVRVVLSGICNTDLEIARGGARCAEGPAVALNVIPCVAPRPRRR
jgi:threonine dehydrogenase-like Zn-dependent dehydrogenase